jgi:hypothetical protein
MTSKAPPPSLGSPAGVPPSGNAKYVVIAVILLGLIAAAIVWKKCPREDDNKPIAVVDAGTPVSKPTGRNPDDDVPPPPPIEDAGADAGKKIVWVNAGNKCDACKGTADNELSTALSFRAKQAHRCYDNALAQDSTLKGKISIAVRVGSTGQVCSAGIASNEMGSPVVANCVVNYFRGANFPAPKGGCADINVPISFVPK